MKVYDIFLDRFPKLDLHGYDRDCARVAVDDFINEAVIMGYSEVVIIHGIGSGVVRNAVGESLAKNKKVISYHLDNRNVGCTVVKVKID